MLSVSECFAKHIRSLNLNEFPCVDSTKVSEIDPQVEELIDLIRDEKSPWYKNYEWSTNCDLIRETYIKNRRTLKTSSLEKYFTNLRFNNQHICVIDANLRAKFTNLTELVLTCNQIERVDFDCLPASLKLLDLSGNYLRDMQVPRRHDEQLKIEHLGLAFNSLETFDAHEIFTSSLVSLDLSHNRISDLCSLRDQLVKLKSLKNLVLYGNPIVLLPGYRGCLIDSLPNLFSLDDKPITRDERITSLDLNHLIKILNRQTEVWVQFSQIKNLIVRELPDFEDSPEIYVYKYLLRFYSIDDQFLPETFDFNLHSLITYKTKTKKRRTYRLKPIDTEELEPAVNIDLNEKGLLKMTFKSIEQLRDFCLDGTTIDLIERRIDYQLKDERKETAATSDLQKAKKNKSRESTAVNKSVANPTKKKKNKKASSMLDNFSVAKIEDRIVASFDVELNQLLDGHLREIVHTFTHKLAPIEVVNNPNSVVANKKKKETSKKQTSESNLPKKKATILENMQEIVEPPPLELDFRLQVLDFATYKDVIKYVDFD